MVSRKDRLKYGSAAEPLNPAEVRPESHSSFDNVAIKSSWEVPELAPLAEGQRGLILGPPVVVNGSSFSTRGFDLQDLRYSLLFFDKIAYASNNLIHIAPPSEFDWLCAEGCAEIVTCRGTGLFDARCILESQKVLYKKLDEDCPGVWGVGRSESSAMFLPGEIENQRGLLMKLFGTLPVPDVQVPLEDIVRFKQQRAAELSALRYHIEKIYQSILASPDQALAERAEFEELRRSLNDHRRVTVETGWPCRLTDVSFSFSADHAVTGAIAAAAAAHTSDLNLAQIVGFGAAAALAKSLLSIGVGFNLIGRKPVSSPFEYVSGYHKELFG
ncbi:MAG: hypothetical protein ACJA0Y_001482 [Maricaulis maris]|jgi:hypothetical protein